MSTTVCETYFPKRILDCLRAPGAEDDAFQVYLSIGQAF